MEKLGCQIQSIRSYLDSKINVSKLFGEFTQSLARSFQSIIQEINQNITKFKNELIINKGIEDDPWKNTILEIEVLFKKLTIISSDFDIEIEEVANKIAVNDDSKILEKVKEGESILQTLREKNQKLIQKKAECLKCLKAREEKEKIYNESIEKVDPTFVRNFNSINKNYLDAKTKHEEVQNQYNKYLRKVKSLLDTNTYMLENIYQELQAIETERESSMNKYLSEIIKIISGIAPSLMDLKSSIELFYLQKAKNMETLFKKKLQTLFTLDQKSIYEESDLFYNNPLANIPSFLTKSESTYLLNPKKDSFTNLELSPVTFPINISKAKSLMLSESSNTEHEESKEILNECLTILRKNEMINNKEEILDIMKKEESIKLFSDIISKHDIPIIFTENNSFICFKEIILSFLNGLINQNCEEQYGMFYQAIIICKETWMAGKQKIFLFSLVNNHDIWKKIQIWIPTIELILESKGAKPGKSAPKIRQPSDFEYKYGILGNLKLFVRKSYKIVKKMRMFKRSMIKIQKGKNSNTQIVYEQLSFFALCFHIFELPKEAALTIIFEIGTKYELPFDKKEDLCIEFGTLQPFKQYIEFQEINESELFINKSPVIERKSKGINKLNLANHLLNGNFIKKKMNLQAIESIKDEQLFEHHLKASRILFLLFKRGFIDIRFVISSFRLSRYVYQALRNKVYKFILLNSNINQKHEIRIIIWKILLGLNSSLYQNESKQELIRDHSPQKLEKNLNSIQLDIDRSYSHIKEINKDVLLKVLKRFVSNNSLDYIKGMNYIVGFLIYIFKDEETCLKIFETLISKYNLKIIYGNNLRDIHSLFYIIDCIIGHLNPQLQYHFKCDSISSQ